MQLVPNEDPNRQVRATIWRGNDEIIGQGWNAFAPSTLSTEERWADKHRWVCHAEEVAIHNAYRRGNQLVGSTIVTNYFPCARCANHIVLAGIGQVSAPTPDLAHPRWGREWQASLEILKENGVAISFDG